jgi:hypothetical protein
MGYNKKPKQEPFDYDNHWKVNFNYKHLGSHDFPLLSKKGKDLVLTIKRFYREEVVGPSKKAEMCNIVEFKEDGVKDMIVNKTNFNNLTDAFGTPNARAYLGQKVAVYVDHNVRSQGGEIVSALRFRTFKPKVEKTPITEDEMIKAARYYAKVGNLDRWHEQRVITPEQEQQIKEAANEG